MLGESIKNARQAAELTQEQLAAKARLSREYISLLERDQKSPTITTLGRICRVMNIKPSELLLKAGM